MRRRIFHKLLALHDSRTIVSRPNLSKISKCTNTNREMATDTRFLLESRAILRDIFRAAVKAVSPNEIIRRRVKLRDNALHVDGRSFPLKGDVYLVGFGKAVMGMAVELERVLGDTLRRGIVSVPSVSRDAVWASYESGFPKLHDSRIDYRAGGVDNRPDGRSLATTHDIIDLVEKLTVTDTLVVLVSGGGSALLYMPRPVLDQDDKLELCKRLQNAGADITELNTVRKKLSLVKGGGLARIAYPASVITLILSDIVGDPVDLIASGPTVYSPRAPEHVVAILKKYNLFQSLEGDLKAVVTSKETFNDKPLLNPAKQFKHVANMILGNNTTALEAARLEASRKKLTPILLRNDVTGNVQDVSSAYVHITSLICLALLNELDRQGFYDRVRTMPILSLSSDKVNEIFRCITGTLDGIVLIGAGEPTVVVTGRGKGGRNQELALRFSLDWLAKIKSYPRLAEYDVTMLSAGTDGQDGPTDAAGAFGYPAIAPVMHDLYAKVKFMGAEENLQAERETTDGKARTQGERQQTNRFITESNVEPKGRDFVSTEQPPREDVNEHLDNFALKIMQVERMLPENVLKENDTYNFYSRFKKGADLVKTGHTGTNVMDLHFIYIKKRPCKCEIESSDRPTEDILDVHDLHIDALTIEKYKATRAPLKFEDKDGLLQTPTTEAKAEKPFLNVKIIDENFTDPCCKGKCIT